MGGGGGRLGGWRVNDAVMGITNNWVAIVVELAAIRVVGKEFLEELFAGGWILLLGAWFSITVFAWGCGRISCESWRQSEKK